MPARDCPRTRAHRVQRAGAAGADGLVWTEETLDRYLADPLEAVPGTTMGPLGIKDAAERRAVIEYLNRFK